MSFVNKGLYKNGKIRKKKNENSNAGKKESENG